MMGLEFKAALGIVAVILAACSIFANFVLIDMCYTRMEKEKAENDAREWEKTRQEEIAQMEKRLERHRMETITRWMQDVADTNIKDKRKILEGVWR